MKKGNTMMSREECEKTEALHNAPQKTRELQRASFSDLADMLQRDDVHRIAYLRLLWEHYQASKSTPRLDIIEFASRPDMTANTLYRMDRLMSVASGGLRCVPSRDGFSIFYSDRSITYSCYRLLKTLDYSSEDCDVLRLPYSSNIVLQFWDEYKKKQRLPNSIHNYASVWLLLEHFQQVRWYAIMDATSVSEVEMEKEFIVSQFPENALKRRACAVLNTVIGTPVTSQSQRLLMTVAAVLSFSEFTPSEKEVKKYMRRFGVDKAISPAIRTMIKTMKEQDKLSELVPIQRVRFDAILHWQRAIRMQIKKNRQDREQTARNRVETRKREIVRVRCSAAKLSIDVSRVLSQPGPSGPQKKVAWVARDVTPSESAKRGAKKKMAYEAIMLNAEHKRVQMEREAKVKTEKLRNLQIGEGIMRGQ